MDHPTPYQKKTLWTAITGFSMALILAMVVFGIWVVGRVLGFLQPILVPVAIAGVLAYLLDPVVVWMHRKKISRFWSVIIVFATATLMSVAMLIWLVPTVYTQSVNLVQAVPVYAAKARVMLDEGIKKYADKLPDLSAIRKKSPEQKSVALPTASPSPAPLTTSLPAVVLPRVNSTTTVSDQEEEEEAVHDPYKVLFGPEMQVWVQEQIPEWSAKAWSLLKTSVGGFIGFLGYTVGFFMIPIYLFFLLAEGENISNKWSRFVPLRASHFKDEVVVVIEEINGYVIAFFRGQLIVSIIDGILIGTGLLILGLPFALLIGLMVCFLCIIPYLGVVICWLPAVIIAAVEFKDWLHPAIVTGIFILVQQLEGTFISPKIVGDAVGLHPMTIIISVFAWSLLLGGLLGAILAIPLTATLKVLLSRYVWQRSRDETLIMTGQT